MIYGEINEMGEPQIMASSDNFPENGELVALGTYQRPAYYHSFEDTRFVVFGPYFEGLVSPDDIGKAFRLTEVK